jgi:hypothetical protein
MHKSSGFQRKIVLNAEKVGDRTAIDCGTARLQMEQNGHCIGKLMFSSK